MAPWTCREVITCCPARVPRTTHCGAHLNDENIASGARPSEARPTHVKLGGASVKGSHRLSASKSQWGSCRLQLFSCKSWRVLDGPTSSIERRGSLFIRSPLRCAGAFLYSFANAQCARDAYVGCAAYAEGVPDRAATLSPLLK
jgi:hypothetical protein